MKQQWYIIKTPKGQCQIISVEIGETPPEAEKIWGPFNSQEETIARRVGLIRSGQCQPL
jgi:hypothetical protein